MSQRRVIALSNNTEGPLCRSAEITALEVEGKFGSEDSCVVAHENGQDYRFTGPGVYPVNLPEGLVRFTKLSGHNRVTVYAWS